MPINLSKHEHQAGITSGKELLEGSQKGIVHLVLYALGPDSMLDRYVGIFLQMSNGRYQVLSAFLEQFSHPA
jgi:hypothetical protein